MNENFNHGFTMLDPTKWYYLMFLACPCWNKELSMIFQNLIKKEGVNHSRYAFLMENIINDVLKKIKIVGQRRLTFKNENTIHVFKDLKICVDW